MGRKRRGRSRSRSRRRGDSHEKGVMDEEERERLDGWMNLLIPKGLCSRTNGYEERTNTHIHIYHDSYREGRHAEPTQFDIWNDAARHPSKTPAMILNMFYMSYPTLQLKKKTMLQKTTTSKS